MLHEDKIFALLVINLFLSLLVSNGVFRLWVYARKDHKSPWLTFGLNVVQTLGFFAFASIWAFTFASAVRLFIAMLNEEGFLDVAVRAVTQ